MSALTVSVKDLSKRFNREWIFKGLNYTFVSGNVYAITGPNGSGKSTLLQVLWGQTPPTAGSITYTAGNAEIPIEEISRNLTIATPYMDLIDEFTLEEQVNFHFRLKAIRNQLPVQELYEIMYLDNARHKVIGNFSSGMRQRVKLALAFYTQAQMVFLDEPGTNLDVRAFEWYVQELRKLPRETLVFIASNNAAEYPEHTTTINLPDFKP